MGDFMYFPDNKMEYIPSLIILAIFVGIAFLTVRLIIKISKREEEKARILEKKLMDNRANSNHDI